MENESTSTWAFLKKSGEIVNVEPDLSSSSDSSIEFIHDDVIHYERSNYQLSFEPQVQKQSHDVAENSLNVLGFDVATDNVSTVESVKDETNRCELTLENISSVNSDASASPNSTSPVSPSSSDDSSGSVTLLEGRLSDGDLDTFPEDFWFDSDFELLDQHSNSDLAHLQLAAGANNALPSTLRPKINFKFKKQASSPSKTETESVNACDADDESSNNVELCSSTEDSEVAPVEEIPPVTNIGSLAPVLAHLPVPTSILKPPRMSITFLMLVCLVMGLLLGFVTKYSVGIYSSEQLSEDIDEIQRLNEMHLLKEENEHMRKYVESLKGRINNLQNSNKQELSDELRQLNQLLKGRINELDQQIVTVRQEIFEVKSGVQPPTVSDKRNQDLPAEVIQNLNQPASDNDPESQAVKPGPDPESQAVIPGPDPESQAVIPGPDPESQAVIPGPDPESQAVIPGPDPESQAVIPGPDPESQAVIPGPDPESQAVIPGPDPESQAVIPGPDPESQAVIPGPDPESQAVIPGPDPESQAVIPGPDPESQAVIPGPDPESQAVIPGPDPESQAVIPGPDPESQAVIPGPDPESQAVIPGPDPESQAVIPGPDPESQAVIPGPDPESQAVIPGPDPESQAVIPGPDPESQAVILSSVGSPFHDDNIQIHSSPEERVPEESISFNPDSTDQTLSGSGVFSVIHQNDASVVFDEIIKSENKADDIVAVLQIKLDKEKRRADNLEKLYAELKRLVESRKKLDSDSSALLTGSTVEIVQEKKAKKVKESVLYCLRSDKDCSASMDWLNRDAMLQLITSVVSDIPPQAQQWKKYITQKFQSLLDPQEFDEDLIGEPESNLNFQSKKFKSYMNRILHQLNRAKEDLHKKFEKTLHKIKKGTSTFWAKNVLNSEKERKFKESKEGQKDKKYANIRKEDAKYTSSQDSSLQLTEENNYLDVVDVRKEHKINPKTEEFGQLQKELEIVEMEQNIKKSKKIKSSIKEKRHQQPDRSEKNKKQRPYKSDYKDKKHHELKNKKQKPHKSDKEGKKYRPHKLNNEDKKHQYRSNDMRHWPHKSDNKDKNHRYEFDDKEHWPRQSGNKDKKHQYHEKHRLHKSKNNKINLSEFDDDEEKTKKLSAKNVRHSSDRSDDTKMHLRKHKYLNKNKNVIDRSLLSAKSPNKRNQMKIKEYNDGKKLVKDQKRIQKKSKTNHEMKIQSKQSCDQLAVNLKDSVNTISKERFRRMYVQTILRMSKKLSNFNKQCKHFSSKSVKEWSACQQMWWTLCGRGLLSGQLQKSKCQRYLLSWQMSAAVSPDGGGKPGCDDCGCQKKVKDSLDQSNEDWQNVTDSDSAFPKVKEGTKVLSGEWYFKHKSVPAENKEQDCDEDRSGLGFLLSLSTDLWDELADIMPWFKC